MLLFVPRAHSPWALLRQLRSYILASCFALKKCTHPSESREPKHGPRDRTVPWLKRGMFLMSALFSGKLSGNKGKGGGRLSPEKKPEEETIPKCQVVA